MRTKVYILAFIYCTLASQCAFAQKKKADTQEGILKFISWLSDLETHVNDIYKEQKRSKLIRQLGYIATDLDDLAIEKSRLADKVISLYKSNQSNVSKDVLNDYKASIERLSTNLSSLLVSINEQYKGKGQLVLDKIRADLYNRKETELEKILRIVSREEQFDEEKIRKSAQNAEKYAKDARDKVLELRQKLLER